MTGYTTKAILAPESVSEVILDTAARQAPKNTRKCGGS